MAPEAAGWDWCGINLLDGGSLMGFRMRDKAGGTHYAPPGMVFKPLRTWKSPRTGVEYPVEMQVNDLRLEPLMDDQELDSRASTGTIYWEGAVRAFKEKNEVGQRLPRAHRLLEADEALSEESAMPPKISAMPTKWYQAGYSPRKSAEKITPNAGSRCEKPPVRAAPSRDTA